MTNPKGTPAETAIVKYLRQWLPGTRTIERRAKTGRKDRGDISGIPGVVIEVKNQRELRLAAWLDEAEVERINDNAVIGVVWHKRRGKGSPADWYVTMTGANFVALLEQWEA